MNHPGIVRLNDYIEQQDGIFLIMEYVDGRELSDYVQNITGPIVEDKLVKIFIQLLKAFKYAHIMNIIHRDIKPSNVIIDKDENVKILDFGIAKILEDTKSLTKTGTQLGTVYYMSPEQVKGDKNIDQRSDIYSLGVTLFHLASGQNPYNESNTEYHILNKIVNEPLPKASSIYPGVSERMEEIIAKATAKDPKDRYQNCDEFIKALENSSDKSVNNHEDELNKTKVINPSEITVKENPKKKNKKLIIGVTTICLLILSLIIFWPSSQHVDYLLNSKHYVFKNKKYNSFIINSESEQIKNFQLLENINKVPHNQLLKQLKTKNDSLSFDTLNNDSLFIIGSVSGFSPNCSDPFIINNQKPKIINNEDSVNLKATLKSTVNNKNGWFVITDKEAKVIHAKDLNFNDSILMIIESGSMLIQDGDISSFVNKKDSSKIFAVGSFIDSNDIKSLAFIQSDNNVTQEEIAVFMKVKLKCQNAAVFGNDNNLLSISNLVSKSDGIDETACKYLCYNEVFTERINLDTNSLALFKPKTKPKKKGKKQKVINANSSSNSINNTTSSTSKPANLNPTSANSTPQILPSTTVRNFLTSLNEGKFKEAFKMQNISRFNDEQQFCSSRGYGATDEVIINEVYLDKIVNNTYAYVVAKYVSFDKINGNFEVEQEFQLFNSNGNWIIIEMTNLKPAFKF